MVRTWTRRDWPKLIAELDAYLASEPTKTGTARAWCKERGIRHEALLKAKRQMLSKERGHEQA